jgi:high-affinity iron transporter
MLASLLIVFREVLEAGLVVGIVFAATEGIAGRALWIGGGIAAGVAGASLLALFAGALSSALSGEGQEYFDAAVMLAAVAMLGWHHLWMADHGRELAKQLKNLGSEINAGRASLMAMAVVVALAILREGSEVVLFLYGIVAASTDGPVALFLGGVGGLVLGAAVSFVLYRGLVAIPTKRLFQVTGALLTLLAAGLAGQAFAILAQIGAAPTLGDEIWNTSWLLRDDSLVGRALHVITGYTDRPSGVQLLAYGVTLAAFVIGGRMMHRAHERRHRAPILQGAEK